MEFRSEVKITPNQFIQIDSPLLLLGSCFSENIGNKLLDLKLDVVINPFGILYQPNAIANALERILEAEFYTEAELIVYDGLFHSPDHHGAFSTTNSSETLFAINAAIKRAHEQLKKENIVLLLTWGTARGFKSKVSNKSVANCHKFPAALFDSFVELPDEIVIRYSQLFEKLKSFNPTINVLFSISPIRHKRDGFVANQHSKSILFVAMHQLLNKVNGHYFPAYEIVMDELRDYRFYANDMLHPSELAINYIWDKFVSNYFNTNALQAFKEIEQINKLLAHRPIHQNREAHFNFLKKTENTLILIKSKYPFLDFETELNRIRNKIHTFETND